MAKAKQNSISDDIPAFDRAMRGLIKVPKAELDAELKKSAKPAKAKKKPSPAK